MAANTDPQRRPLFVDRVNQRLLADPAIGGSPWPVVTITPGMFADIAGNTIIGRYGTSGSPSALSADVVIDLVNTATTQVINAARVAAASTSQPGVVQLDSSTNSNSQSTAATSSAVKAVYDLASTAAQLNTAQSFTAGQRGAVVALTPGASVTPDFSLGNNFSLTLDQGTTLENPTNIAAGQSGVITVTQDSTGRAVSYGSFWKFNGGAPSLDTTPNSVSILAYYVESATRITAALIQNTL